MLLKTSKSFQSFLGAAIGSTIEYYDYALFSIFLPIMSPQFFPGQDAYHSLMSGYYILTITMLVRPFGGAIFGHIGDFIGRPRALLLSMYGIAITTFIIGITPTYQTIGFWAIVIIIVSKAFQIACFGGEYSGAGIYVVEHARRGREGLTGAMLTAMMTAGFLLATLLGVLVTSSGMPNWSWRLTFLLGGIAGVFGVLYRKNLHESPQFVPARRSEHSLKNLIKDHPRQLLAGVFIGGFVTAPFTTVVTFINPVLMIKGFMSSHQMMWLQSLMVVIGMVALIFAGRFADKTSPRKVMLLGAFCLSIFSLPLLMLVDLGSVFWLIFASATLVIINDLILGSSNAFLKNIFPPEYRYRGSSVSFTTGMSVLGGMTPLVDNLLYDATGKFASAAIWLVFIGLGSLWSFSRAQSKEQQEISGLIGAQELVGSE